MMSELLLSNRVRASEQLFQQEWPDNLVDLLSARAQRHDQRIAYTFLGLGDSVEHTLTYGQLDRRARAVATALQARCAAGDRVVLAFPPCLDFMVAFLGCLYAGVIAVPVYPPHPTRLKKSLPVLHGIVASCGATFGLTQRDLLPVTAMLEMPMVSWLAVDAVEDALAADWKAPGTRSDTVAFLQYTSGSTSQPKGVVVSHANLLHNEKMIALALRSTESLVACGWLPLYHDMGLIGNMLQPLCVGGSFVLMSPLGFLQRPVRWLKMISDYGAATSGAPNFAYDYCVRKITDEQMASLDLSRWTLAYLGAEPVRADTLERFAQRFASVGFRASSYYPGYGLAEATLMVSGGIGPTPLSVRSIDPLALEQNRVVDVPREQGNARRVVGCGRALLDERIVIADPERRVALPADTVGEIWVSGRHVAGGYFRQPELSQQVFAARLSDTDEGPFLRTGDLGFLSADDELFVVGRIKDLIIIDGRNHHPADLELSIDRSHAAVRSSAAFSVEDDGPARLVVVAEVDLRGVAGSDESARVPLVAEIAKKIREAVAQHHDLHVTDLELLEQGRLPRTTSGKTQRPACKAAFLTRTLETLMR
jgi:acyl-CoA synthetase (AMP-forming)/AMP-acid ligase II